MLITGLINAAYEDVRAEFMRAILTPGQGFQADNPDEKATVGRSEKGLLWITRNKWMYEIAPADLGRRTIIRYEGPARGWLQQQLLPSFLKTTVIEVTEVKGNHGQFDVVNFTDPLKAYAYQAEKDRDHIRSELSVSGHPLVGKQMINLFAAGWATRGRPPMFDEEDEPDAVRPPCPDCGGDHPH